MQDFAEFTNTPDHNDAVVVGLAPSMLNYDILNTAFRILSDRSKPVPLLATHKAKFIRSPDGGLSLGPGPFVTALESTSGVSAEVIGKPSTAFFSSVIQSFGRKDWIDDPRGIAVIGDDIMADLGEGAVELGLHRILGVFDFLVKFYI